MAVMIVVVTVADAVADRRRGLVAVLTLGHAQLLRRFGAEFTCWARAIAARHFPRMRFPTFVELRCSSRVVVLASGRADIPDTGGQEAERRLHRYRGSSADASTGTGGSEDEGGKRKESRVMRLTGYLLEEEMTELE